MRERMGCHGKLFCTAIYLHLAYFLRERTIVLQILLQILHLFQLSHASPLFPSHLPAKAKLESRVTHMGKPQRMGVHMFVKYL